ncbi:hypothetical protein LZ32DRAFT_163398 [Colletotrichum eremochloae]|nr:hypothetical protein LZ32DRAFT_163398 [Colletotrichum eremochloae]
MHGRQTARGVQPEARTPTPIDRAIWCPRTSDSGGQTNGSFVYIARGLPRMGWHRARGSPGDILVTRKESLNKGKGPPPNRQAAFGCSADSTCGPSLAAYEGTGHYPLQTKARGTSDQYVGPVQTRRLPHLSLLARRVGNKRRGKSWEGAKADSILPASKPPSAQAIQRSPSLVAANGVRRQLVGVVEPASVTKAHLGRMEAYTRHTASGSASSQHILDIDATGSGGRCPLHLGRGETLPAWPPWPAAPTWPRGCHVGRSQTSRPSRCGASSSFP